MMFQPQKRTDSPADMIALRAHTAWQHADPVLQVELERVIRAYVQRAPSFRAALKQVATLHEQGGPVPRASHVLALRQVLHRYVTQLRQP